MEQWAQYGILGLVVIGLATWILKLDKDRREMQKEWKDTLAKISDNQQEIIEDITTKHEKIIEDMADKNSETLKNITSTSDRRQGETNQVIREHTNILSSLKTLLENKKWTS